jgi:hypothetical protein
VVPPREFDFHALRGQFITDIQRHGGSQIEAQKLARHSDPRLTAKHYTHFHLVDLAEAVRRLPAPPTIDAPSIEAQAIRATGTEGREAVVQPLKNQILPNSCHRGANRAASDGLGWSAGHKSAPSADRQSDRPKSVAIVDLQSRVESIGDGQKGDEKKPPGGFEPSTYALRMRRSTN